MNDFLDKYWSSVICVAFLIVSLALVTWLSSSNLPGKGLLFKLVSRTPLEVSDQTKNPPMDVYIAGKPVNKPFLTTVIVKNTGNIPILRDDYETPIKISVKNDAKIVQVHYELEPRDINTKMTYSEKDITLTPALLNPGDNIFVQVFTTDVKPDLFVGARIMGVDKIVTKEWEVNQEHWGEIGWVHFMFFLLNIFVFLIIAIIMRTDSQGKYVLIPRKTAGLLFVSIGILAIFEYFTLLVDHGRTVFSSRLLLIATVLVAYVGAWKYIQKHDSRTGE